MRRISRADPATRARVTGNRCIRHALRADFGVDEATVQS